MADKAFYSFVPWYRAGLAAAVGGVAQSTQRATLQVGLRAQGGTNGQLADLVLPQSPPVSLIGPGDVIGLDPRAVVRVDPKPFSNDFEPNYLAAVEFFDEDLIYRYSPYPHQGDRLTPWISLLVLAEDEFQFAPSAPDLPRAIVLTKDGLVPPVDEIALWGHVHLNATEANPADPGALAAKLRSDPALGCSRLLSPRRLEPGKVYHAFVVPTFEAGRVAGL